jgi:hypothetical protein
MARQRFRNNRRVMTGRFLETVSDPRKTPYVLVGVSTPGGSLDRRVNCRRVSQPRWVGARRSTKGGKKGDRRKRGNPRPSCCPVPRSGALAVGGYKRPRGRERETLRVVPSPARPTSRTRDLDLPFMGVRRGPRCTIGDVAVC